MDDLDENLFKLFDEENIFNQPDLVYSIPNCITLPKVIAVPHIITKPLNKNSKVSCDYCKFFITKRNLPRHYKLYCKFKPTSQKNKNNQLKMDEDRLRHEKRRCDITSSINDEQTERDIKHEGLITEYTRMIAYGAKNDQYLNETFKIAKSRDSDAIRFFTNKSR